MPPATGGQGMDGGVAVLAADAPAPVGADARSRPKEFEHLQTRADAEAMLGMLVALFPEGQGGTTRGARAEAAGAAGGGISSSSGSRFAWVRPEDVPASRSHSSLSFRQSLVHEDHLTKVLQDQLTGTCSVDSARCAAPGRLPRARARARARARLPLASAQPAWQAQGASRARAVR